MVNGDETIIVSRLKASILSSALYDPSSFPVALVWSITLAFSPVFRLSHAAPTARRQPSPRITRVPPPTTPSPHFGPPPPPLLLPFTAHLQITVALFLFRFASLTVLFLPHVSWSGAA